VTGSFTHFVGRTAELGAIDSVLDELDAGRPAALAIVGEPGIGKTRLLAELAARADERRHLVLTGTASELDRDVPFWVFVDALDEYVRSLDPMLFAPLGDEALAELAQVVPGLPGSVAAPSQAGTQERYRIHRAVTLLLERLAAYRPLVLVLDDLHWADSGSFELVIALLRRLPAAPVLIALAMRPRQVPEQVAAALERSLRREALTRIDLGALTLSEAEELLEGSSDRSTTGALYAESGGNPFYLEQLSRSLVRDGETAAGSGGHQTLGGVTVPAAVAAALTEELVGLSPDGRTVLQGAAVAGEPFDPELAAAAAATDERTAIAALDELLDSDLVRPTDVPRRFRFRHPLVRRAVYESAPGGWRLSAPERCAETLAARGAPVATRAQHVELSAKEGDPAAVAVLREAGEAAAYRAPATAARWFDGALRLLSSTAPAEERVELLLARATSLAATGQTTESHEALLESLRIVPRDAIALRVRLVTKCAAVEQHLGRYKQALARLETALEELGDEGSPEAIGLMIELAITSLFHGDWDGMASWADRAIAASEPLGNRGLSARALGVHAAGAAMVGMRGIAQQKRADGATLVDALSDDELAGNVDALGYLALAEMYLDHFADSGRHAERAMALARTSGQGDYVPLITANLGTAYWVSGRPREAIEVLDDAVEAARLVDNAQDLVWTLFNSAYAWLASGELEVAFGRAQESWELAQLLDAGPVAAHAGGAFATALLRTGDPARAADLFVESGGGDELRLIGGAWRGRYLELLTQARLAAGRRADAERSAAAAQACAEEVQLPMGLAMAELARAAIELDEGDGASAGRRALAAAEMLEEIADAYDAAHARLFAGRALGLAGDTAGAAASLERAAAAFRDFGAARYQAEAEQELRKLGRRVYRRSGSGTDPSGIAALTERELQLARLVVDRKTNPEIAAELFLSQKTVETQLRNIFRKVGVANRVELARAVEQADRAAHDVV
jgi:ATP/maltotriose-dependent transcriptional regulator MalT